MRYSLGAFIGFVIFTILIDYLLHRLIHSDETKRIKHFSFPNGTFWYYSVPTFFIFSFSGLYAMVQTASSSNVYVYFQWFLVSYLAIYLPKLFYYLGYKITHRAIRVKNKFASDGKLKKMNEGRYPSISRKKFLSQVGIVMASVPFISLLFGVLKGRFSFSKQYTKLSFPNLPDAFDGIKIVQISDLHLGSLNSNYEEMEEAVRLINDEHPDLICFTGDLVNNFYEETIGWEKVFTKLNARIGKFSILGNHDYGDYSKWPSAHAKQHNLNNIKSAHNRLGFNLLNNKSQTLEINGDKIAISGVENWGHHPFPQYGDLKKASRGIEEIPFKLLLSHDPDHWDAEVKEKTDYDLTLSGHTHGMQFGITFKNFQWSPAKYKFRRWAGLYNEGKNFLYVNRGLGYLGMPVRVGMPPEITIIELTKGPMGNDMM
ncbi:metallophosphoesterase [Carboxylicivirga sp. M1479]|uniref:metallophosphoesterase n=1 Tax=Carboxylicivirga sp. M1479 TaxID=2594476 RepID=UPI00117782FF|nr:metallophosphoesterase [Carboxylicivirga sp. M1479]TRX66306.1 metallophosphoesterase [Carboxylicivirga sp. M1479]